MSDLRSLRAALPERDLRAAERCAARLRATLRHEDGVVLVALGGGKDSSYALAFVRTMQLLLAESGGATFRLRVVTNRHAGMPAAVLENVDRVYRALGMLGDDRCDLLLVDGDEIRPFRAGLPLPREVAERNRTDILMTGHRTGGNARPTFCNACNLSMVSAFGRAIAHDGGVDVIVTGDSTEEQRAYHLWVARVAGRLGIPRSELAAGDLDGFLRVLNRVAAAYYADLYGAEAEEENEPAATNPRFFSIYGDTGYSSREHWDFLTGFLGFVFDDLAFSFTETDCANPSLMAHLRGLRCERRYGRDYAEGIDEYVAFATGLMARKEFPESLIEAARRRYQGPGAVSRMRARMTTYAKECFDLDEGHLVCMLYAPFCDGGRGLPGYLDAEQPHLRHRLPEIHELLGGKDEPGPLGKQLEQLAGLPLPLLRILYRSPLQTGASADLLDTVLAGDPHKAVIRTRHAPDGPLVDELITGR